MIDFIDMARARNRDAVMKTLRKTLDEDRTKTFTAEISKLGLVEMTRQNVTEGVREIMSRPCPTCEGEGVIRSEETIAIEFERRLRDVAAEHPDAEAFLVQINPRVTRRSSPATARACCTRSRRRPASRSCSRAPKGSRSTTSRSPSRARARRSRSARCRSAQGDEVLVEIVEPHMYDVDDAVAKIDGYIISIAGAAPHVGEKRMVRIDQVGRTAASALLLDESGEVVAPAPRAARAPARAPARAAARPRPRGERARGAARSRAPADSEDAEARREAGLRESPRRDRARAGRRRRAERRRRAPTPRAAEGDGGWPTIQASASWPQRRAAPFGCQGQGAPSSGPARQRARSTEHREQTTCTRS